MARCVALWWCFCVIACFFCPSYCKETSSHKAVDVEKQFASDKHHGLHSHGGTISNDFSSSSVTSSPDKSDPGEKMTTDMSEEAVDRSSTTDSPASDKSDLKKDQKKKIKLLTPKKKDKSLETGEEAKLKATEVSGNDSVRTEAATDSVDGTTTEHVPEVQRVREVLHLTTTDDNDDVDISTATVEPTEATTISEDHVSKAEDIVDDDASSTAMSTTSDEIVEDVATSSTSPPVTNARDDESSSASSLPEDDSESDISSENLRDDKQHGGTLSPNLPLESGEMAATTEEPESTTFAEASTTFAESSTTFADASTTFADATESPVARQSKQLMDQDDSCPCGDPSKSRLDPISCRGERTVADPSCHCRQLCAKQKGESCAPAEPCDVEFGLHCNLLNDTCQGPISFEILDITHNAAKLKWDAGHSELQPQASVSYSTTFRGSHTQWIKAEDTKPVILLKNLIPGKNYYLKIEKDGKQEISTFKTKDTIVGNMPKILVKQRSQTTLTVVWDDFRLPSYHSEYILEYRPAGNENQNWTKVQAGTQTIVTVTHLTPNMPYQIKVAVWEDEKLELPSEVITAYTSDGCVRENRMYSAGEEFFHECDFRCICNGNNETDCSPRCNAPYVKVGSKTDDPLCYEKPLSSDPCCVMIRCTESKALEDNEEKVNHKVGECPAFLEESESASKLCLSDCDLDGDCSGELKCCPSSCGGAVCVKPLLAEDICESIYCGPQAECNPEKKACECLEGYIGNPHDFLNGCTSSNSTEAKSNKSLTKDTAFELDFGDKGQREPKHETQTASPSKPHKPLEAISKNELGTKADQTKETIPGTEAPFELDLSSHVGNLNKTVVPVSEHVPGSRKPPNNATEIPNDEDNFHLRRPQDRVIPQDKFPKEDEDQSEDLPMLFGGCEYNNITYDRGVRFEDGCDARCICDGPGHVSCVPRCTVLSSGGPACREVRDPDDACCKIMVCSFPGSENSEEVDGLPLKILSALAQNGTSVRIRLAISMSHLPAMVGRDILEVWFKESADSDNDLSQWNKKPITQKDLTEIQQGIFEFDLNNLVPETDYYFKVAKEGQGAKLNMAEFSNTVNVKTFPAAVKAVFQACFHHNQSYELGEVFYQGCEYKCICREKGFIECQDRCEIYIDTVGFEGCDWVPSEEDPCCTVPSCQRRKIPLMPLPDGRPPFIGGTDNMCVVDTNEVYRVGDIWESGDGCKTKICRCTLLVNGSTSIQCQSECPPLPPNAHIPTARCPHPVLIKPDGPCSCPYVGCNDAPRRVVQPPRPQCEYKGKRYDMSQEFHDGCIALCHCGQDLRVNCAAVECPYHFSAEFTNCLEWDIDPDFFPSPPHCCAPAKCKNDGSCTFSGRKFENFEDIPSEILPCGARCVCVNGNVTCENRCPPIEDVPPVNLPCSPNLAFKGHPADDTCCLQWMCKEPAKQAHCTFQGSRYPVSEQWEVRKGSQHRICSCHLNAIGSPEVECKGGCPQIPQRFLLPTEQCLRPVIITPEDPVMCPYVVCNNTLSGQELYNVNVMAMNSTAVRIRFSLSNILVGLIGHAELHFTTDPTLPPAQWHIQKFSRPKRLFDSPNIEYILNALRPNTTYFLQVKIKIDALQGGPESELFKLRMPEEIITTTTTTIPPMIMIDAKPEAHVIDANTVRISWRTFEPQEKKFIYALQLKYKLESDSDDKWITTPMIHRDVTSYFLHDLEPSAAYSVDMIFTSPKDLATKLVSAKSLEVLTIGKPKEDYHLQVSVEDQKTSPDSSEFTLAGIPEPITKYVHVVKVLYKTVDGEQLNSFKVPKTNHISLDHLKPGMKYLAQLELYLTNGQTLMSNEVEFITKPAKPGAKVMVEENAISNAGHTNGKQAELLQSKESGGEDENRAYFIALVVVAVVAAVAAFGFVLLLVILVRRQASAKAPISRTPSESAYDNPTYKTYDGERPEDKTNGSAIQTTAA